MGVIVIMYPGSPAEVLVEIVCSEQVQAQVLQARHNTRIPLVAAQLLFREVDMVVAAAGVAALIAVELVRIHTVVAQEHLGSSLSLGLSRFSAQ